MRHRRPKLPKLSETRGDTALVLAVMCTQAIRHSLTAIAYYLERNGDGVAPAKILRAVVAALPALGDNPLAAVMNDAVREAFDQYGSAAGFDREGAND